MRDVIVVGDVHGDGDRLVHVLGRIGLAEGNPPVWTGGRTAVVFLGDVLDGKERTDQAYRSSVGDLSTVSYVAALSRAADQQGGRVTCLLGNHELMNLRGDFTYVHDADMARSGGGAARRSAVNRSRFLSTWKRAHVENGCLFCHAGVHTSAASGVRTLADLSRVDDFLLTEHRQYMAPRGSPSEEAALRDMLARLGCTRMIIGHNSVPRPVAAWGGLVVLADACLSRAYGKSAETHVLCVRPDSRWEDVVVQMWD